MSNRRWKWRENVDLFFTYHVGKDWKDLLSTGRLEWGEGLPQVTEVGESLSFSLLRLPEQNSIAGGLKSLKCILSLFWSLRIPRSRCQPIHSRPGLQVSTFLLCPHMPSFLSVSPDKGINPTRPLSWPNSLQRLHLLKPSPWGWGFNMWTLGGDKHSVHSVQLKEASFFGEQLGNKCQNFNKELLCSSNPTNRILP